NKIDPVMTSSRSDAKTGGAIHEDAVLALESLGYERYQIVKFVSKLPAEVSETEDIVKSFLKSSV
ncbi:MAG TPA: hypothetical protein ENG14_06620, partial [Thermodesulforhabdus norvegica]|nr:hypothetical protein [Thermodesulforhabdus norvegica]